MSIEQYLFRVHLVNPLTTIFYRIQCEAITSAARDVWGNQEVADDIASNALHVLDLASRTNLRFFCGKPPKSILGGLFYILGYRFNSVKTQREIANSLYTTGLSVGKSYQS
jgi:hypothetical protein